MIKARTALSAALALARDDEPADAVENPNTGEIPDTLIPQDGALAVYEEHVRALNACDWGPPRAVPNDAEIRLPGGMVLQGRRAIGDLFAGFVLPLADRSHGHAIPWPLLAGRARWSSSPSGRHEPATRAAVMVASSCQEAPAMCSDPDSHPPVETAGSGSASGHEIGLIVGDGNRCTTYQADAAVPTGVGMIVLPDYHGLTGFYRELALRFAEDGIDAVAIDYYGRTAEPPPRGPAFDPRRQARQTKWSELQADVTAAAAHLRLRRHVTSLFSIGFCFGGRVSFLLGSLPELQMAGVIGFYGWPVGRFLNDTPAPADAAGRLVTPLLGIFGGADHKIPTADVESFRRALAAASIEHDIRSFEGAPHSFFDRAQAAHGDAAKEAWAAVLAFIESHA